MKNEELAFQIVNIYRQIHVIDGKIEFFNKHILGLENIQWDIVEKYPLGHRIKRHYDKLKNKSINLDQMDIEDRPYLDYIPLGKDVELSYNVFSDYTISDQHAEDVYKLILEFTDFSPETLKEFKNNDNIAKLGEEWYKPLHSMLEKYKKVDKEQILTKIDSIVDYEQTLKVWYEAQSIINIAKNSISQKVVDELKSKWDFFKTHLEKFGKNGVDIIDKLERIKNSTIDSPLDNNI
ncbi:MAG: hypothetical protein JJV93_03225 [Alphaproteobacteria bacterium]|nr:hypothetical protein [Alphaproteobacteria bacterium]MBL0718239.1 hypothetical protein [Alphaproteobacteria bacterium]